MRHAVPPLDHHLHESFWDKQDERIQRIYVYPSSQKSEIVQQAREFFHLLREKGGYLKLSDMDQREMAERLKFLSRKKSEDIFEIMRPHAAMLARLKYPTGSIGNVYELYIVLRKALPSSIPMTVLQDFGRNGEIQLKISGEVVRIKWFHTYYGLPMRHEEYITIENMVFCREPKTLGNGEEILRLLSMQIAHSLHKRVLSDCMIAAHAPERLAKHFELGGTLDTWDEIMGEAQLNSADWRRVCFSPMHRPWTKSERDAYCKTSRFRA